MKWFSQALLVIYSLSALYFLYMAVLGTFVYFANKSMGHYESFLVPGRNWVFGLILGAFAFGGWKLLKNPAMYKIGLWVTYFPFIIACLFVLWFAIVMIGSGGKWN